MKGRYACEEVFTFGLWGAMTRPYELGLEGLLRDMRRLSMNCLVHGPRVDEGAEGLARVKQEIALCHRYGMFVIPVGCLNGESRPRGSDISKLLRPVAEALKDEPSILGWYILDEPPPEFLPEFLECQAALAEVAPRQPALCLFYRPDAAADFAPHQPLLLTDCYPLAYWHGGTSLGPHFAIRLDTGYRSGLKLSREMGQFNLWGNRGILEWMDLCRVHSGGRPHWITLQVFESGDGDRVRWRGPTVAEIRLQTYLAVAGGAKGINYFHYGHLTDAYGNPKPAFHGEQTPLLEEIGRLGAELTPLGPLLLEAEVAEPFTVIASLRPTPDPGTRVEVRHLHSRMRDVDYLVVFNNDPLLRSTAQINLSRSFLHGRHIYDLHDLQAVTTEELPGAVAFPVTLEPGGGRIFSVASEADSLSDARTILLGRCRNEAGVLDIDYELAENSQVDLERVRPLRAQYQERRAAGEYAEALSLIRQCSRALGAAMKQSGEFWAVKQDLEYIRRTLGRLGGEPRQFEERLSKAYRGLLGLFWEGQASLIRVEVEQLRGLVEQVDATAVVGAQAVVQLRVEEEVLRAVEQRAQQYLPKE